MVLVIFWHISFTCPLPFHSLSSHNLLLNTILTGPARCWLSNHELEHANKSTYLGCHAIYNICSHLLSLMFVIIHQLVLATNCWNYPNQAEPDHHLGGSPCDQYGTAFFFHILKKIFPFFPLFHLFLAFAFCFMHMFLVLQFMCFQKEWCLFYLLYLLPWSCTILRNLMYTAQNNFQTIH